MAGSDEPRVWNLRDKKNPPPKGAIYCGRGTPYGNPYIGGKHGSRETVIRKFVEFVLPDLDVSKLRGKHLVCWCKPLPCHCDHILLKANAPMEPGEYEGDPCNRDGCEGEMVFDPEDCACHIAPPCGDCLNGIVCSDCGHRVYRV